ncbi:MAG: UbiA family prenyltransferase [Verrucomicrobiales bacterium]|nr:UbiA family prenyltransferase [Verrucomicrobiales bacterium]MCP5557246.1 UbiA family prenyltransferase [Verrucomicrobiaceae bacterium]
MDDRNLMRAWLELSRISNLPTVWTNALAAWAVAFGGFQYYQLGMLMLGGSLLYTAGMILNDVADVRFDRQFRPERPIPSGRVSLTAAWFVSSAMIGLGAWFMMVLGGANGWLVTGLVLAIIGYDFYHKPWAGSVIVMGACRTLLYLSVGYAAGAGRHIRMNSDGGNARFSIDSATTWHWPRLSWDLDGPLLMHAVVIGFYIVGLTLVARGESRPAEQSRWMRALSRLLLWSPGLMAAAFVFLGGQWLNLPILVAFVACIRYATRRMRAGGPAIGDAVGWLLAGIVIVDALAIGANSLPIAAGIAACAPLLRLWQRKIAAT